MAKQVPNVQIDLLGGPVLYEGVMRPHLLASEALTIVATTHQPASQAMALNMGDVRLLNKAIDALEAATKAARGGLVAGAAGQLPPIRFADDRDLAVLVKVVQTTGPLIRIDGAQFWRNAPALEDLVTKKVLDVVEPRT